MYQGVEVEECLPSSDSNFLILSSPSGDQSEPYHWREAWDQAAFCNKACYCTCQRFVPYYCYRMLETTQVIVGKRDVLGLLTDVGGLHALRQASFLRSTQECRLT
jgi:hypothetical protein